MRRMFGGLALLALCAAPSLAAPPRAFVDPLDVPAAPSRIADRAPMMAVTRTPGGRLVACGRRGIVLLSDDGKAWRQAAVPVSTDLVALHFATATHGWAVGQGGVVLHSADGGAHWSLQLDGRRIPALLAAHYKPLADGGNDAAVQALADAERYRDEGPGRPLLAVWFENESNGLVVGAYNLALQTTDGGRSWQVASDRFDNPQGMHLYAIGAVGEALWVAGEQGLLLKGPRPSAGAGGFARVATPYPGTFFGIVGQGDELLAFGLRGNAVRSGDGGASWQLLQTGTRSTLTGAAWLPGTGAVLVGMGGDVRVAAGTGAARGVPVEPPMPLYGAATVDGQHVVLAGARGVRLQALVPQPATDRNAR